MIIKVNINKIQPNPYQPESRLLIDEETSEKFGKSILEHGLLQTPVARMADPDNESNEFYQMGDGWLRRSGFIWLVAHGHPEYQEIKLDIRDITDLQMAEMILEANGVRKDLTPIDEAKLYKKYMEDFKVTQAALAKSHNISQGEVANKIRLLELPAEIQENIISKKISEAAARQLLRVSIIPEVQKKVLTEAVKYNFTVSQMDQMITREQQNNTKSLQQTEYTFNMNGCADCQKAIMVTKPDWQGGGKEKRCADPGCWKEKQNEFEQARVAKITAEKSGSNPGILSGNELKYGEFEIINSRSSLDNPEECETCAKKALYKHNYNSSSPLEIVCLNPTCFKSKKSKKTRDENARLRKQDQVLTTKLKESFSALSGLPAVRNLLIIMAKDLVGSITNQEGKADMLVYFPDLPTVKGKLDIEAAKGTFNTAGFDTLVQICAAAFITRQRRQYSGEISPKLTGKIKQNFAILTGKNEDYINEVKAFEEANCRDCGHCKTEVMGTGEDCCQAPYYRKIDDTGKCTGKTVRRYMPEENNEEVDAYLLTPKLLPCSSCTNDGVSCHRELFCVNEKNNYICDQKRTK